jgi:hypothetical protein
LKNTSKVAIVLGIICIILTASLAATITNYNSMINTKDQAITSQKATIGDLQQKVSNLETLVFHVSEKGEEYAYAQLSNATQTYNQILTLNNNTYQILLLPEYKGHLNWIEELTWLAANFEGPQGIPIMLDVFGGGNLTTPTPMLTTEDISKAMAVANVKYLRFAEVISWHIENKLPFPTDYVREILAFCKANNLKLFWTEWKNDSLPNVETFTAIQNYIKGYEDIVTVSFSTNSNELEPTDGFLQLNQMFQQWGTSIQPWYWNTTRNSDLMDMPASLLLEQALSAKGIGAKIIEFEPYWYFFDNGEPNNNLKLLMNNLT